MKYFLPHCNFIGTERLTFTSAKLCGLHLSVPFSLIAHVTLSVLHFFIPDIGSKVSQLPPSSIILKIFCKSLMPREQQKLILTSFNLENILSNLALETGTVNNNLIITGMLLQPLLLGAIKILLHVTRYEAPVRKRVFIAYSTNSYHCSKSSIIDTLIPASFKGIWNCAHGKN